MDAMYSHTMPTFRATLPRVHSQQGGKKEQLCGLASLLHVPACHPLGEKVAVVVAAVKHAEDLIVRYDSVG